MDKVLEVLVIFFFMIGFLTIMYMIINYCVDFWFNKIKKK
jgi:hypothetical protein